MEPTQGERKATTCTVGRYAMSMELQGRRVRREARIARMGIAARDDEHEKHMWEIKASASHYRA